MIIDIHTHNSLKNGTPLNDFIREMDQNGVSMAMVSILGHWSYNPDSAEITKANRSVYQFCSGSPDRLKMLVYLNPQNTNWRQELRWGKESGAAGVKLWLSLKDENGSLDNCISVLRACAEYKLPVLIHTYLRKGEYLQGELTPVDLRSAALTVPEAILIAAHSANWYESRGVLRGLKNVYLDASGTDPEQGALETIVGDVGSEHILFGSDMNIRSTASQLSKIRFAAISDEEKERILWKNAVDIFSLDELKSVDERGVEVFFQGDVTEDHYCFCGRWPFSYAIESSPEELTLKMQEAGFRQSWAGHFDGIFASDLVEANTRYYETVKNNSAIIPLATINPKKVNWKETLIHAQTTGFNDIIVWPSVHGWDLSSDEYKEFFLYCAAENVKVTINCRIGDIRFTHTALNHRTVLKEEIKSFLHKAPADNTYVVQGLNSDALFDILPIVKNKTNFYFTLTHLTDHHGSLRKVISAFGSQNLVMGSEYPFRDIRTVSYCLGRV
jgi:uncharacterized protein